MYRIRIYHCLAVLAVALAACSPVPSDPDEPVEPADSTSALAAPVEDGHLIVLNGYPLDTRNPEQTYSRLPSALRRSDLSGAIRRGQAPAGGLYLVQLNGPVQDEALDALLATGVELVSYIPYNAYVIRASSTAAAALIAAKLPQVQFLGDYEPGFRLSRELRHEGRALLKDTVDVIVQVVDSPAVASAINALAALGEVRGSHQVGNFHNVRLTVRTSQLDAVASVPDVFAIELQKQRRILDEAQGQIVAGNVSAGGIVAAPGYLTWLGSKGFNGTQFTSFAVEVTDDAYSLSGHPDLPNSRIAFEFNPTGQTGPQGGHGFLNSHIVGGFNNGTGAAVEDWRGYNYGLGIAPWARVGVTAIFGNGAATSSAWESAAYAASARISSNSWGLDGAFSYDTSAQEFDRIVRDAQTGTDGNQQMIVVFAAGNDGSAANTIGSPATAKNVISVGASENDRQAGLDGCNIGNTGADNANDIIGFSSRGPVNSVGGDGRVKPDLVAPGTHIQAGIPQTNYAGSSICNPFFPAGQTLYGWSSGTSHSTPAVSGGAALVYQDFLNKGRPAPSPAMTKAVLVNSAQYMTGVGANDTLPSNSQGMGRMNLGRAFDTTARILVDQTQVLGASGTTHQITGSIATSSQPFRVTLAWTDAPGATTGGPWVNDLDLEVTVNGTLYRGNVFSGATSVTGGVADSKNNVESVFLPEGTTGNFTITVKGTNIAGDGVPGNADITDQDFALVIYNATAGSTPTIGASPSGVSFTSILGGANPASQSLNIANTGGGTLTWSASDNAAWLTLSSISGTAPSTTTLSVNTAGLAAGTYTATITLTSAGASNSPKTVPVTLTILPALAELLINGGFEDPTAGWTFNNAYWTNASFPHTGTGYSFLGNADNTIGSEFQQVFIPPWASGTLTFWLSISTNETTTTTAFDKLFVEVTDYTGTVLTTLATYSNLNAGPYSQKSFSLAAYKGQTVRIQFRGTTDGAKSTIFRIDDVSLK